MGGTWVKIGRRTRPHSRKCTLCNQKFWWEPGRRAGTCPACVTVLGRISAVNAHVREFTSDPSRARRPLGPGYGGRSRQPEEPAVLYGLLTASDVAELERRRAKLHHPPDAGERAGAA